MNSYSTYDVCEEVSDVNYDSVSHHSKDNVCYTVSENLQALYTFLGTQRKSNRGSIKSQTGQ